MVVMEGKEGWARRLVERREEQGLPSPSIELVGVDGGSGNVRGMMTRKRKADDWMRRLLGVDKELRRMVVSFI